ncbi:hypothetical protein ACJX0J_021610, partial [Zea mays]
TLTASAKGGIGFFWSWSYWSTFILTWAVVPTIQGYEDAGDFTVKERLKTSIHMNLLFYSIVGAIGLIGVILLLIMHRAWDGGIVGFAMACSNTFGLVTGAFLLGFGLSEIPRNIWKNAYWSHRQKVLSHRVAKMAVKLDNAHQEYSNAIVVAQATSNQMSKRDILRPYMDIIDNMLSQMLREDPSFKPSGGRFGENDMDYDTDDKSMATLRRQLRRAHEEYYRGKSEYMTCVMEALKLEDTIKNYERRDASGWKYVSSFRDRRSGTLGPILDTIEFIWQCILRKQLQKAFAVILGCMSAAILLAEATLLPSVDLSLFSILIKVVGKQEVLVQVAAFVPLMYMFICTYYSLFKIGMLMFYSLTPRQTSSVSLLMICSMVARYAPPISYNFLNLIRLGGNAKTTFEKRMGNIDDAVPFFGRGFNKIYPLIMVVYTLLVASNFFGRVIDFLGSWKRFKLQQEEENIDGLDPSGMIIVQKERSWIEQGCKVGEHVIPLARNFNGVNTDIESQNVPLSCAVKKEISSNSWSNTGNIVDLLIILPFLNLYNIESSPLAFTTCYGVIFTLYTYSAILNCRYSLAIKHVLVVLAFLLQESKGMRGENDLKKGGPCLLVDGSQMDDGTVGGGGGGQSEILAALHGAKWSIRELESQAGFSNTLNLVVNCDTIFCIMFMGLFCERIICCGVRFTQGVDHKDNYITLNYRDIHFILMGSLCLHAKV